MLNKEPAVILGALGELVRQVLPALVVLEVVKLTEMKLSAIYMITSAAIAFLTIVLTRSQTVSTKTANSQIETAIRMPESSKVKDVIQVEKENRENL